MKSLIIISIVFCLTLSGCMEAIPITFFSVVMVHQLSLQADKADKVDKISPQLEEKPDITMEKTRAKDSA